MFDKKAMLARIQAVSDSISLLRVGEREGGEVEEREEEVEVSSNETLVVLSDEFVLELASISTWFDFQRLTSRRSSILVLQSSFIGRQTND